MPLNKETKPNLNKNKQFLQKNNLPEDDQLISSKAFGSRTWGNSSVKLVLIQRIKTTWEQNLGKLLCQLDHERKDQKH